jgi:hypothetical protein
MDFRCSGREGSLVRVPALLAALSAGAASSTHGAPIESVDALLFSLSEENTRA